MSGVLIGLSIVLEMLVTCGIGFQRSITGQFNVRSNLGTFAIVREQDLDLTTLIYGITLIGFTKLPHTGYTTT